MRLNTRLLTTLIVCAVLTFQHAIAYEEQHCVWSPQHTKFLGSDYNEYDEAACLLTPVKPFGHLGENLAQLPWTFDQLLDSEVLITPEEFSNLLDALRIGPRDVGGSPYDALSENSGGVTAKYFVLHDTATPLDKQQFPDSINTTHRFNNLSRFKRGDRGAHLFINRRGEAYTNKDFGIASRASKFETVRYKNVKGLFLHVELVQPRLKNPEKPKKKYSPIGPSPGFTDAQYEMLALAYVAASVRRGQWLVPVYHRVLDDQIFYKGKDPHDDPQNFELDYWSEFIKYQIEEIAYVNSQ